jgi:hypothetical protein
MHVNNDDNELGAPSLRSIDAGDQALNSTALALIAIILPSHWGRRLSRFCRELISEDEILLFLTAFLYYKFYVPGGNWISPMLRAGSFESKVVIVGGGCSGAAIAARLLRSSQVKVHVIEERPRLGLGLGYGDAQDCQILNVPAGRMGFWTEQPTHFLVWAKLHGPSLGGQKPKWPLSRAISRAASMVAMSQA